MFKDYSNTLEVTPKSAHLIRSLNDVSKALEEARAEKYEVAIQGAAHSMNRCTLSNDMILSCYNRDGEFLAMDNNVVEITSYSRTGFMEMQANSKGLHIPCLQDKGFFSVGGTISVGGFGYESIAFGSVADQVIGFSMVLADGETVWCSPQTNPDYFYYGLCGMGQLGFIHKIQIKTIAYKPFTKWFRVQMPTLNQLLSCMDNISKNPDLCDLFHARFGPNSTSGHIHIHVGKLLLSREEAIAWQLPKEFALDSFHSEIEVVEGWPGRDAFCSTDKPYRIWTDFCFDSVSAIEEMMKALFSLPNLETCPPLNLHDFVTNQVKFCGLYLMKPQQRSLPLSFIPSQTDKMHFSFGYYAQSDSRDDHLRFVEEVKFLNDLVISLRGRPYNYSGIPFTEEQYKLIYGETVWAKYKEVKKKADPQGLWKKFF